MMELLTYQVAENPWRREVLIVGLPIAMRAFTKRDSNNG